MSRGYMFEVSRDKDNLGSINASFYETYPLPAGVDGIKDDDRADETLSILFDNLVRQDVEVNREDKSIILSDVAKKNMFRDRFLEFKSSVEKMTEDDFINDVYKYSRILEDKAADLVYDADDKLVYTWDEWFRTVPNNVPIYFGNVMIIR